MATIRSVVWIFDWHSFRAHQKPSMRKTTFPDHHKERNKQRKTKPQAIHHHNPPGTKFARQILERTYTKAKTLEILGL